MPNHLAKSVIVLAIEIKNNSQGVRILTIIMCNGYFNDKAMEVNECLKQLFIEKNIFLIYHSKKTIYARIIHKIKVHLNKSGTSILSGYFVKVISNIWRIISNIKQKVMIKEIPKLRNVSLLNMPPFNNDLNFMHINHVNKLIFAQLKINSLRNKFDVLLEFARGKVDI